MAGYDLNSIDTIGNDPMFLAAHNSYNPNFMSAYTDSTQTPQVTQPAQAVSTQTQPQVDYSTTETDSNTGLVVGLGIAAAGVASTIYAAKKGKGNILEGFKSIFKSTKDAVSKNAEKSLTKKEPIQNIAIRIKDGKPVFYIPGKTKSITADNEITKFIEENPQLKRELQKLRYGTNIDSGTFSLTHNNNKNTITFEGNKIKKILNNEQQDITNLFVEDGQIRQNLSVEQTDFINKISDYINNIRQYNSKIDLSERGIDLKEFIYTTQVGGITAKVYKDAVGKEAVIKELTMPKEFNNKDEDFLAYVAKLRERGINIDSTKSEEFLMDKKLPNGYKVLELTLKGNENTIINIVDNEVAGVTINGKFYNKNSNKCIAYLEAGSNRATITKMLEDINKGESTLPEGATIIPV